LVNNSRVLVSNSRLIWTRPEWWGKKQVEDWNEPNLMALQDYDDGIDLSSYDFDHDNLGLIPDATNKRKLAYRHRFVGHLYSKVQQIHPIHICPLELYTIWYALCSCGWTKSLKVGERVGDGRAGAREALKS